MYRRIGVYAALLGAASIFHGSARADVLPAPSTLAECVDSVLVDDPGSCTLSGHDASAFGSLTLAPFVSLVAEDTSGAINALGNPGAGVFVSLTYSFQITGGNPGDQVPILIATDLDTSASSASHAYGFASLYVSTGFGNKQIVACTNDTCGTTDTSFSGTLATSVFSGQIDTIQLEIEASSGDSPNAEWANASADPYIYIDPSFAGAGKYSVEVSPGVGNAPATLAAVPEPSSVCLLAGVASAVALLRRGRRRSSQGA